MALKRASRVVLCEVGPRVSEAKIKRAERELGVRFPSDYRRFLIATNGGEPNPSAFVVKVGRHRNEMWLDEFLQILFYERRKSFGFVLDPESNQLEWVCEEPVNPRFDDHSVWWHTGKYGCWLPRGAVVIGTAAMGRCVVFMCTRGEPRGHVCLLDCDLLAVKDKPEQAIFKLSDTFSGFLASLTEGSAETFIPSGKKAAGKAVRRVSKKASKPHKTRGG